MKIVFFGTYDTRTTPRIQVMIEGLRSRGVEVAECNAPLFLSTADRVAILRHGWRLPLLAFPIVWCWIGLIFKARQFRSYDAVIVGHLGQFDVHLARFLFRRTPIALDYMVSGNEAAYDRRVTRGWKDRLLMWLDKSALEVSDSIILDTEEHLQSLPAQFIKKGVVVNVGATKEWFDAAKKQGIVKKRSNDRSLHILFFGNYTPLQGTPTIGKALSKLDVPVNVTMVGAGQDKEETLRIAMTKSKHVTITWIDWLNAKELSEMAAMQDVCLGVFGVGPKSYKIVPNKVYQGAAAGCAIITSDTPPQRRIFGNAAIFIPAGDHEALTGALRKLASNPSEVMKFRKAAFRLAQEQFTPARVVKPLLEMLMMKSESDS